MLSLKQQQLLRKLQEKNVPMKNNEIYSSISFYKTITYLRKNKLIEVEKTKNGSNYTLTMRGSVLARVLDRMK